MDIFVEQFPFLGTKIVQKHRRNTEGRTISMPMYIYIFPTEKKWHRISFILYLICLVHFSTNTHPHAHTHSYTLFHALFHLHKKVENIQRTMIGIMWLNRSCIVVFRLNRDWVYYSGWILCEGEKKLPQITVLENKMARHHGTCHPFFFLFFSSTKTKQKNMSTVKFDWKIMNDKY